MAMIISFFLMIKWDIVGQYHTHVFDWSGDPANTIEFISIYSATNSPLMKIMVHVQIFVLYINCSIFFS